MGGVLGHTARACSALKRAMRSLLDGASGSVSALAGVVLFGVSSLSETAAAEAAAESVSAISAAIVYGRSLGLGMVCKV